MRSGTFCASIAALTTLFVGQAMADAPKVIASIKPIHSLVSQVMAGVGEPGIIVDGAGSPHTYSLMPSKAAELQEADVIFWVGGALEPFLVKPVETLGAEAKVVELAKAPGVTLLPYREGGPFETHAHEEHAQGHDESHAEADHHDEGRDEADMHLWLDPQNAKALLAEIEEVLSTADPENAERYEQNVKSAIAGIDALQAEIEAEIARVKGQPFIVFHDAYQYFENRFGIPASGSITVSPEVAPGAHRVAEMREKVERLGAICVFAEPQFEPKIINTVIEGTKARSGVLDPEGADIPNGPELYGTLLRNIAKSLRNCLSAG